MNAKLYIGVIDVKIDNNELYFGNYPFEPAFVFKNKRIGASQIEAIYFSTFPISLKIGEDLIFVSTAQEDELKAFAIKNQIPMLDRKRNWNGLTEPFLDAEYSIAEQEKTLEQLQIIGFTQAEVEQIRQEIEKPLTKYNNVFWEEYFLGLYDVLLAMRPIYNQKQFNDFYWKAIEIEQRNKVVLK